MEELPSLLLSHIANESRERAEKEVAILVQEASKEIERLEEEKVRRPLYTLSILNSFKELPQVLIASFPGPSRVHRRT